MDNLSDFVDYSGRPETQKVVSKGAGDGGIEAGQAYPYAVFRSEVDIRRLGEQNFQAWSDQEIRLYPYSDTLKAEVVARWNKAKEEAKRLYVSGFVGRYLEVVAEYDRKAGKQPTPTPATTPTGAIITITKAEHTGDIHRYWLKLEDPTHLEEPYEYPDLPVLRVDFSDTTDIGTVSSSGTTARGSAASDPFSIYKLDPIDHKPTQSQSKNPYITPQKEKKPRISWE